jgi:hypothetical protein
MEPKDGDIASFELRQIGRRFPMNGSQSGIGLPHAGEILTCHSHVRINVSNSLWVERLNQWLTIQDRTQG